MDFLEKVFSSLSQPATVLALAVGFVAGMAARGPTSEKEEEDWNEVSLLNPLGTKFFFHRF